MSKQTSTKEFFGRTDLSQLEKEAITHYVFTRLYKYCEDEDARKERADHKINGPEFKKTIKKEANQQILKDFVSSLDKKNIDSHVSYYNDHRNPIEWQRNYIIHFNSLAHSLNNQIQKSIEPKISDILLKKLPEFIQKGEEHVAHFIFALGCHTKYKKEQLSDICNTLKDAGYKSNSFEEQEIEKLTKPEHIKFIIGCFMKNWEDGHRTYIEEYIGAQQNFEEKHCNNGKNKKSWLAAKEDVYSCIKDILEAPHNVYKCEVPKNRMLLGGRDLSDIEMNALKKDYMKFCRENNKEFKIPEMNKFNEEKLKDMTEGDLKKLISEQKNKSNDKLGRF